MLLLFLYISSIVPLLLVYYPLYDGVLLLIFYHSLFWTGWLVELAPMILILHRTRITLPSTIPVAYEYTAS